MATLGPKQENVSVICTTVTIAVQDIPDESSQDSGREVKARSRQVDLRRHGYFFTIFPNGLGEVNRGYVSLLLCYKDSKAFFEGMCIVCLIDSSDTPRFTQTFPISYTAALFHIEKYVSRKRLLSDTNDLIPNGLLILRIETQLKLYSEAHDTTLNGNFKFRSDYGNLGCKLLLDSPLAKRLSEISHFFRAILVSQMIEMRTGVMPIEEEEFMAFMDMVPLVMGSNILKLNSLKRIFDMYIVADKYDIPFVIETCLCFLKLYASAHDVDELIERINKYEDESLKELVEKQIALLSKTNLAEEITKTDLHVCLKQPVYNYLWMYPHSMIYVDNKIVFKNVASKYIIQEEEENYQYDFYK